MEKDNKSFSINISNGFKLVAEQNRDPQFQNEIYVGIENTNGIWHQDFAIIRHSDVKFDEIEVLVYADKNNEDYTNKFSIKIRDDND